MGLLIPAKYGGSEWDCVTAVAVLEALGYGCRDHGLVHAICTQTICGLQLKLFGTEEQKAQYLPSLVTGDLIFAQGMTEPDAGSDAGAIRTHAVMERDRYLLNGRKTFMSNGPIADIALVFAVTDPEARTLGRTSCFIVPTDSPGVTLSKPIKKMGLSTLQNGDLLLEDCEVAIAGLLGKPGGGGPLFGEAMDWERILIFATQVGKLERVLERTIKYVKARKQFGQSISRFQAVSHPIANMKIDLELARLATYKAAWLKDQGSRATLEASIAKVFVSERLKEACLTAIQLHGGYGYMAEYELERELRDSIAGTIYSGTSEINRNIIAALSGL